MSACYCLQVRVAAARQDVIIGFTSARECRAAYDVLITPEDDVMAGVLATMWDDAYAAAAACGELVGQVDLSYLDEVRAALRYLTALAYCGILTAA